MKEYTTGEVAELTGATRRQLQWWDEQGVVVPERRYGVRSRQRFYSSAHLAEIRRIMRLRSKYRLKFASIPKGCRSVRVICEPTMIGRVLIIPRWKGKTL